MGNRSFQGVWTVVKKTAQFQHPVLATGHRALRRCRLQQCSALAIVGPRQVADGIVQSQSARVLNQYGATVAA